MERMNAGKLSTASSLPTTEQIQTADECARRTLDICMSKTLLNKPGGARATAGYSALVRRSCQLRRSKEKIRPAAISEGGRHQKFASRRETSRIAIQN